MGGSSRNTKAWEEMFHPTKPTLQKKIPCCHCKKDSGYTNEDLIPLRGNYDLRCKQENCNEIAIKVLSGAPPSELPKESKAQKVLPWGERGKAKKVKKKDDYDVLDDF